MDKHIIGENAGKLWRLLSTDAPRKWTLQEVKDATGFNDLEAASAIGWLAREDKIQFHDLYHIYNLFLNPIVDLLLKYLNLALCIHIRI